MKQKQVKSLTSLFLILTSVVSLFAGCSTSQNTDSTDGTKETTVKETVEENIENQSSSYKGTQHTLMTSLDGIKKFSIQDEKILGLGYVKDVKNKEAMFSYYFTSWEENWNEEWKEKKKIPLPFTTVNYTLQCNGMDMDSEGNIYIILTDSNQNHIHLVEMNVSGEVILNSDIIAILLEDAIVTGMTVGSDGKIYLEDGQANVVYTLDKQGNLVGTYKLEEGSLWDLPKDNNNNVYLITEKKNQLYVNTLLEGEELLFQSNGQGIPVNNYMHVYEGFENTFFIPTINGLISYHLKDSTTNQLVDWTLLGINYNNVHYIGVMEGDDEEQVITMIVETEYDGQTADIYTFVEYDPSEDQHLVLATLGEDSYLRKEIRDYNKLHPEYPIQIKTYFGDEKDALRQLNTDLLAGNVIDIIDAKSFSHITSLAYYAEQGLLEDIGAWIEQDETIDVSTLLPNLLEANKIDGVLYNLVPSFQVETFAGAKSVVGDDFVWTMDEALDTMQNGQYTCMYAYQSKEQFIRDICLFNGAYLVNEEEGTCQFDSEAFIELLTYANTISEPNESIKDSNQNILVYNQDSVLYKATPTIKGTRLNLSMLYYLKIKALFSQGFAQDEMSLVGFPTMDENDTSGSVFVNMISIAMASTSQKKEQAWGFFQYLLSDEYQNDEREVGPTENKLQMDGFPARASSINLIMQKQLNNDEGYGGIGIEGVKLIYGCVMQEDIDAIENFVHSITRLAWENETITNIVWEEAQYYFAGECTAEQAAQRMQSRVELYLMEKE